MYEAPYGPTEPIVCLDEKPVTLHAEVRLLLPLRRAGKRAGTANTNDAGRHFTFATPDRSGIEFAQVVFKLAMEYSEASTIHLVLDNLNIHRRKSLTDLLGEETGGEVWNRLTVHYTPTHGSWRNQAEIESACLGDNASVHGAFRN